MRHRWNENNACTRCGLFRDGFSGGRTGHLTYYSAEGFVRLKAGPCILGIPLLIETALRRAAALKDGARS
jgi:hypothetical protein